MSVSDILPIMQTILAFCNICIIGYAFIKFMGKPHNSLEQRVTELEVELKETKQSLLQGNDKFREHETRFQEQDKTNATFKSVMLAFIDFEIAYCLHTEYKFTDDLMKAKDELQKYLAQK